MLCVILFDGPGLWQGFSVEGQENIQEILSKQLLLCQFLTALSTLRTGEEAASHDEQHVYQSFASLKLRFCSVI